LIILLVIALFAISIAALVFMIIASIKAYSGEPYRYPVSIRFIK
jgi:uncharacterized Tic20 family protein